MNCFVFDIDGTLIDTAAVDQQSFQQALREFGYHYSLEELRFSFGMPGRKSLEKLAIPAERIEPVMARWETLSRDRLHEVEVYEGIIPMLEALHAAGKRCGIVTSRTRLQLGYGFTPGGMHPPPGRFGGAGRLHWGQCLRYAVCRGGGGQKRSGPVGQ